MKNDGVNTDPLGSIRVIDPDLDAPAMARHAAQAARLLYLVLAGATLDGDERDGILTIHLAGQLETQLNMLADALAEGR